MNRNSFRYLRRINLLCLLAFVLAMRFVPYGGEFYATYLYPTISRGLSWISSFTEWSLEEILITTSGAILLLYPLIALICKRWWLRTLLGEIEIIVWLYVWFYIGWGGNYFRTGLHERLMIHEASYNDTIFLHFLTEYTDSLNTFYYPVDKLDEQRVRQEIKNIYCTLPKGYGLTRPTDYQQPKKSLFNDLYSSVGVLGFMGPFFDESQLNEELLPIQYPFTYAHELAHLLGVSNEAEANFWAHLVCIHSDIPEIKSSGYFTLLPLVMKNASKSLSPTEYDHWLASISPSIIRQKDQLSQYWKERENPLINDLQKCAYNLFLKGNNIQSGTHNYGEVIGMLVSVMQSKEEPLHRQGRQMSIKQ